MTLELLFARAAQGRVFLLLTAGGAALGLLLQLAGLLHRWNRFAGMAADALWAFSAGALVLLTALYTGTGLRMYGLLGLLIGLALYRAGVYPLVRGLAGLVQKMFSPQAGKRPTDAES